MKFLIDTPKTATRLAVRATSVDTLFGAFVVGETDKGICFVGRSMKGLHAHFPDAIVKETHFDAAERVLAPWRAAPPAAGFPDDIVLHVMGTPFQVRVWQALSQIPWGETRSYKDIAAVIDAPRAVRAVGGANGANPIALVVPCHRVIAADGGIGGYAWGTAIKARILGHERDHAFNAGRSAPAHRPSRTDRAAA